MTFSAFTEEQKLSIMSSDMRYEKVWVELLPKLEEYKKELHKKNILSKRQQRVSNKPRISVDELASKRKRCGELKKAGLPCNEFSKQPTTNNNSDKTDEGGAK